MNVLAKKNARNIVVVAPFVTFKLPRDLKLPRIFKEFYLSWKAFLRGLSPPVLLIGPVLVRSTVKLLKDFHINEQDLQDIESSIKRLAEAGIEHRELRHPERHVGKWRGKWVFIDFDHGRLTSKSRDVNKFRAWAKRYKGRRK